MIDVDMITSAEVYFYLGDGNPKRLLNFDVCLPGSQKVIYRMPVYLLIGEDVATIEHKPANYLPLEYNQNGKTYLYAAYFKGF